MKMQAKVESRIVKVLDEAIELASLGNRQIKAQKLAEQIYATETELIAEVSAQWIIERLTWMITRRRRAQWYNQSAEAQMILPDPIFQGLPKTVFLRNGERPRLMYTVLAQTEDHLRLLRERFKNDPRVRQFEAVVELHRKWSAVQKGIVLVDAMRREAEEREA